MSRHALFLSLAVCTGAFAAPQLPRHADLDLHTARQLADASLAHCSAALTVLDRGGNLLLSLRADGVGPHNSLASQRKAYTALSTKTPTRLFAEAELVGALGIAGAGGAAQDESCAIKAAEQLGLKTSL